jgi:hypothetical protein
LETVAGLISMKNGDSGHTRKPLFMMTIQESGLLGNRISLRKSSLFSVGDVAAFLWSFVSFIRFLVSRPIASRGHERLDCPHFAFFADAAFRDVDPGEPEQRFLPGLFGFIVLFWCAGKKPATGCDLFLAATVAQETVMPDFHESVGKDMQQKPPDKFSGFHGHDLCFVVIGVIAPPKGDFVVLHFHDPVIADRDPMGVSAEIIQNVLGMLERLFAVDDPVFLIQVGNQGIEGPRRRKMAYGAGVDKFVLGTELFQISDKLPPKELRHNLDVDEEVFFA